MTLRQKQKLVAVLGVSGLAVLLMDTVIGSVGLAVLGVVLVAAALPLNLAWMRCPSCGMHLGRCPGDYCKLCGAKIPWNEKKKRIL